MSTYYVNTATGNDSWDGTSATFVSGTTGPKATMAGGVALLSSAGGDKLYYGPAATETVTVTVGLSPSNGGPSVSSPNTIEGYAVTPGDRPLVGSGNQPILTSATNSLGLFTYTSATASSFFHLRNIKLTHTAATRGYGINSATGAGSLVGIMRYSELEADGVLSLQSTSRVSSLYARRITVRNTTSATTGGMSGFGSTTGFSPKLEDCKFLDNAGPGLNGGDSLQITGMLELIRCTISGNAGAGFLHNSTTRNNSYSFDNCTFEGNGAGGININVTTGVCGVWLSNNVCYGNLGGYGVSFGTSSTGSVKVFTVNTAYGSNTSGPSSGVFDAENDITLTADPFINSAAENWSPNTTSGGGALLRAAGGGGADIGAAQHQDSGGGSTVYLPIHLPRRIAIRERVTRRFVSRIIPGQNTATTQYIPVPQPRRQYQRFTPGRRTVVPVVSTTINTVTAYVPLPQPRRQFSRTSGPRIRNRVIIVPATPIPIVRKVVYTSRVPGRSTKTLVPFAVSVPVPTPFPVPMRGRPYRVIQSRRVPVAAIVQSVTVNQTVLVTTKRTVR